MIVNRVHKFVFVHIPKTAGTSLREALGSLSGRDMEVVAGTKHETPREFLSAYRSRCGRDPNELQDFVWIAFVRNPWDRFLSLHRYLRLPHHRRKWPQIPADVNDFARLLEQPPEWTKSIRSLRPQTDYIEGCDPWIGRFETLTDDFAHLKNLLGFEGRLRHLNQSSLSYPLWPFRFRTHHQELDEQSRQILTSLYAEDIERFGYCEGYNRSIHS